MRRHSRRTVRERERDFIFPTLLILSVQQLSFTSLPLLILWGCTTQTVRTAPRARGSLPLNAVTQASSPRLMVPVKRVEINNSQLRSDDSKRSKGDGCWSPYRQKPTYTHSDTCVQITLHGSMNGFIGRERVWSSDPQVSGAISPFSMFYSERSQKSSIFMRGR